MLADFIHARICKPICAKLSTLPLIDQYIYFYNNQRIQVKTKLTSLELRSQYAA
ncbi:MAG TPA: IS3 family transposase [Candidatus Ruthenibacterium merdavium]|uniref:IS3 family transposase n=1 Tax=Candidatus Ruthenibacterium merdavium TaxID=2838752 RepID=A0A9D2TIQ0_9FIRM|nr:IS3 family transposase [Candidatus Ruthenibacterium merdavium]